MAVVEMKIEVMLRGSNEDLQTVWEDVKFSKHESGTCSCNEDDSGWLLQSHNLESLKSNG